MGMRDPFDQPIAMDIVQSAVKVSGKGKGWRRGITGQLPGNKLAKDIMVLEKKERVRIYLEANRWCTQAQVAADLGMCYRSAGDYIRMVKRDMLQARKK